MIHGCTMGIQQPTHPKFSTMSTTLLVSNVETYHPQQETCEKFMLGMSPDLIHCHIDICIYVNMYTYTLEVLVFGMIHVYRRFPITKGQSLVDLDILGVYLSLHIYYSSSFRKHPSKILQTKARFDAAKFGAFLINPTGTRVVIEVFAPAILLDTSHEPPSHEEMGCHGEIVVLAGFLPSTVPFRQTEKTGPWEDCERSLDLWHKRAPWPMETKFGRVLPATFTSRTKARTIFYIILVVSTHVKNMRKSNWIISQNKNYLKPQPLVYI